MKTKKPIRAWLTSTAGFDDLDGVAVVAARTEAGAKGRTRAAAKEAGYVVKLEHVAVDRLAPLDSWISAQTPSTAWNLQIALYQEQDSRREALGIALVSALAAMRKDGQGLSLDQETTIRRGLGLA